ncbi:MAG: elongation factor P hydroxylase [Tatlockia sp.]
MHRYEDLITLFNHCFREKYQTVLAKGEDEPIYLPADANRSYHTIFFAHGFFRSALHECAHWLIAGEARRKLVDFGYWYAPDGRNEAQQEQFQQVEVKPQALEWILSVAAGHSFCVSVDNLNGAPTDTSRFTNAVLKQVALYCQNGLWERANAFRNALCQFYGTDSQLKFKDFKA